MEDFEIIRGDTLAEPKHIEGDRLRQFDVILANPPYSIKQWNREAWNSDKWGRNSLGTFSPFIRDQVTDRNPFPHVEVGRDADGEPITRRANPQEAQAADAVLAKLVGLARRKILFAGDPGTLARRLQWEGPVDHLDAVEAARERAWVAALANCPRVTPPRRSLPSVTHRLPIVISARIRSRV